MQGLQEVEWQPSRRKIAYLPDTTAAFTTRAARGLKGGGVLDILFISGMSLLNDGRESILEH